jgi:hypothetical protein
VAATVVLAELEKGESIIVAVLGDGSGVALAVLKDGRNVTLGMLADGASIAVSRPPAPITWSLPERCGRWLGYRAVGGLLAFAWRPKHAQQRDCRPWLSPIDDAIPFATTAARFSG